ncbi:MAG TPA: hypothetical protein VF384_16770 [Planctomycetota bacterium]
MELAAILVPICSFLVLKMLLDQRASARSQNIRLLEEALKNPQVDRALIESLTFQLTGSRPPQSNRPGRFMAVVLAIGWLSLFTGLGIMAIGSMIRGGDETVAAGALVSIIGFGLVTYPFALRELEARRSA